MRVARLEGIVLPMGILIIAAILSFEPRVYKRAWACVAMLPIGLALILTVGRSMWISLFVGLIALGGLVALDKRASGRRVSRFVVVSAIPLLLLTMGYVFQQQTRTAFSDVARDRVTQSTEAITGRLLPYGKALEKIRQHPLLGGGHGQTVTFLSTFPMTEVITVGSVDNVYLTIGMRMGLIGIAAFLWVYVTAPAVCVSLVPAQCPCPHALVLRGVYRHLFRPARPRPGRCHALCQSVDLYSRDIFGPRRTPIRRGEKPCLNAPQPLWSIGMPGRICRVCRGIDRSTRDRSRHRRGR